MFPQAFQNLAARARQRPLGQLRFPSLRQALHLLDQPLLALGIFGLLHPLRVQPHKGGRQFRGFQIPARLDPQLVKPI